MGKNRSGCREENNLQGEETIVEKIG